MKHKEKFIAKGVGAGLVSARKERGITLIALVITIIVLLISAGVTIAMVVGDNGILSRARNSKDETIKAEFYEKVQTELASNAMNTAIGDKTEKSLGEILLDMQDDGDIKSYDRKKQEIDIDGNVTVSVVETVKKVGDGKWLQAGTLITNGDKKIIAGEKINYHSNTSSTIVTLNEAETGYKAEAEAETEYEEQKISLKADGETDGLEWIVIGAEDGQIVIAPTTNVTEDDEVYLQGQVGYENGINVLDKISAEYGKGTGAASARSINVEDLNRITLYRPEKAKYGKDNLWEYGNEITYYWNGQGNPSYKSTNGLNGTLLDPYNSGFYWYIGGWENSNKPTGTTTDKTLITKLINTNYQYYPQTLTDNDSDSTEEGIDTNSSIYKGLFSGNDWSYYWLGSQCVYTGTTYATFNVRCIQSGKKVLYSTLFYSGGNSREDYCGVRPTVTLKSDISLKTDGDYNEEGPNSWLIEN